MSVFLLFWSVYLIYLAFRKNYNGNCLKNATMVPIYLRSESKE